MALAMDFGFLFDRDRQLLSIGFLAPEGALDSNCYDLLASEARLASFFAIAKGDVAAKHWFRLGRAATPVAHGAALISWSGSMFEYLMPSLVMRAPAGSLLEQTNRLVVRRQIDYAAKLGLPWGISESAYNARDLELTYQYSNFGVPGLGLKRGLGENRVIAPYATALAAMVDPRAAAANLARLAKVGAQGRYGFYEALDYTPTRVPEGESVAIVRAFMAHHQGMTIVAIANALFNGVMRERFHAEPIVQATELLLQERMPRDVAAARPWAAEVKSAAAARDVEPSGGRRFASAHQATPATHLLSNGRYATMLTAAGSGYSRWGDLALTRWREDATCDDFGSYLFVKDVRSGVAWSAGFQPSGVEPDDYAVVFNEDRAEFTRRDGSLTTTLDVLVSAEDDAEVRRVSITNSGGRTREIEITSYAELVLAPQSADIAHPAFSKLFVETEYLVDVGAILATRRRRAPSEPEIWAAHLSVVDGEAVGAAEFETDRARFLGRGRRRLHADRRDGQPAALEFDRRRARPDLRAPPPRPRRARRDRSRRLLDHGRLHARCVARRRRQASRRHRVRARLDAGLDAGAGAASSSRRDGGRGRAVSAACGTCDLLPRRPCALPRTRSCGAPARSPACGRRAFPAICRSCCCASPMSNISTSSANCCRRMNIGG